VRVLSETFFMKVRYSAYCAAKVATELERKYTDPTQAQSNQNWRKELEDILTVVDEESSRHHRRMVYNDSQDDDTGSENETDVGASLLHPSVAETENDVVVLGEGDVNLYVADPGGNAMKISVSKIQEEDEPLSDSVA